MFYGSFMKCNGEVFGGFYGNRAEWKEDNSDPGEVLATIDLTIHGKTYAERKEDLRRAAHEYLDLYANSVPLSWDEVWEFESFFHEQGAKYGLLREFKENAIC